MRMDWLLARRGRPPACPSPGRVHDCPAAHKHRPTTTNASNTNSTRTSRKHKHKHKRSAWAWHSSPPSSPTHDALPPIKLSLVRGMGWPLAQPQPPLPELCWIRAAPAAALDQQKTLLAACWRPPQPTSPPTTRAPSFVFTDGWVGGGWMNG